MSADLLWEVLCTCVKDTRHKKLLRSFHKAESWIDWNQGAICENVSCLRESMAESIDRAPAKPPPVKRRCFRKCLRKYTMWSGPSPPLTRKVTLAWTLKFAVVLWNDWTGRQFSVIGKQHSQLHRISKGGAQCRLPCDFPLKSGSWIYCINVGIRLLMCSRKLYCVPYFGDFCSWKHNFGVGKYAVGFLPWEIWVAFPRGKPAATVTLPNLQCVLGVLVFPWSTELWHGLWDL